MTSSKVSRPQSKVAISPLKRGAACLNCRHFKIKCDGLRPHCTPCLTHPKEDGCEYQDGPRSRTKAMEDKIAALEAHIYELEHPNQTPSMTLFEPYQQNSRLSPLGMTAPCSPIDSDLSQPSPKSFLARFEDIPKYVEEEPPLDVIQNLLDAFLPHLSQVGFFLNPSRFAAAAKKAGDAGSHARPCPALLYAVYLWGNFFQHFCDVAQQRSFESRALRHSILDLANSSHPDRVLHAIQANVLMAHYYLHHARLQEASYFASGAAALVTTARLQHPASGLTPPRDSIEAGEMLDAFWTVFTLTRFVATLARPSSPSICSFMEVLGCDATVNWPLDPHAYAKGHWPDKTAVQESPAASFMRGIDTGSNGRHGLLALEAKAVMLLNEAASLVQRWDSDNAQSESLLVTHQALSNLVTGLRSSIPRLSQSGPDRLSVNRLVTVGSMVEASAVILYQVFSGTDQAYRTACVKAASCILNPSGIDVIQLDHVHPVMGFVWSTALSALLEECRRLQQSSPGSDPLSESAIRDCIRRGVSLSQQHSTRHPMVREFSSHVLRPQHGHSPTSSLSMSYPSTPQDVLQTLQPPPRSTSSTHQQPHSPFRISSPASSVGDYGYQKNSFSSWQPHTMGLGLCT